MLTKWALEDEGFAHVFSKGVLALLKKEHLHVSSSLSASVISDIAIKRAEKDVKLKSNPYIHRSICHKDNNIFILFSKQQQTLTTPMQTVLVVQSSVMGEKEVYMQRMP